jgi:DNA-binding CsgD family transcriptional regulator
MDKSKSEIFALTNVEHEYVFVTPQAAKCSGYRKPDSMLGTSVFDIKSPVVEIAGFVHTLNQRVIKTEQPVILFDLCHYENDLQAVITKKAPYCFNVKGEIYEGVATRAYVLNPKCMPSFVKELYEKIYSFARDKKFQGIAYEAVDKYKGHNFSINESKILFLLGMGKTTPTIASCLCNSKWTIETHLSNMKNKLGVNTKEQLIEYARYTNLAEVIPISLIMH